MFGDFLSRLKQAPTTPLDRADAKLALAAFMVQLAKSDRHYAVEEITQIDTILSARYGLSRVEAAKLRAEGEKLATSAPPAAEFAALVKAAVPYEDRSAIVMALWKVLVADGVEQPEEEAFFAQASQTFGIDTTDLRAAYHAQLK